MKPACRRALERAREKNESELLPDRLDQASSAPWPERYPGSFSAEALLIGLREKLGKTDRRVRLYRAQCASGQAELDRLRHSPEVLERDPDALDYYEEELTVARAAHAEAEAKRDRLQAALQEALSRDILYLPPVVSTTEDGEHKHEGDED